LNLKIKEKFPFFKENKDVSYLDSAASSLKLQTVIDSLNDYYVNNGTNVHRGAYKLSYLATEAFEETREIVSKYINSSLSEVIFTKGTTDGLNKLANSLANMINEGDEIITSELEHHSSILPWMNICEIKKAKLVYIPLDEEGRITIDNFKKVLSDKTKVVAINQMSNVLGHLVDVKSIAKLAHEKGAIVIVDAAQSVAHTKIDVKDLDVDFLAFSAHKIFGPNGVGVLYGKKKLLKEIRPFEFGGEMANSVNIGYMDFKDIPYKFEAGTPVIAEVIAFKEVFKFLNEIDTDKMFKHEIKLKDYALEQMKNIKGIKIYNLNSDSPLITFNIANIHPHDIVSILDSKNVYVRAGKHCNDLTHRFLKVNATLRASFSVYNTKEDVDKFISALNEASNFFEGFGD
jgi:cysteine desulfurase / selenocysteine lyase